MSHDARAIANFFIEIARRDQYSLTHLSLQKILFFAHAWHLGKFSRPLVGQKFEAWQYGPVVRVVYDQLKVNKSKPIEEYLRKLDLDSGQWEIARADFGDAELGFLEDIFKYYSKFHAGRLVDLTHAVDGPWERIWNRAVDNAVPGMLIPDEEIRNWILREGGREGSRTH